MEIKPYKKPTYFGGLRRACKDFLELPGVVEAKVLENQIEAVAHLAVGTLLESLDQYRLFLDTDQIAAKRFQKWVEDNEECQKL